VIGRVQDASIGFGKFASDVKFYNSIFIRSEVGGYQKHQVALIDGGKGFIDHLIRVTDRVLYRPGSKNIKFATDESYVRHGRAVNEVNYEKISRFIVFELVRIFLVFLLRVTFLVVVASALLRLRNPLPPNI
jgi:hypothetical protein